MVGGVSRQLGHDPVQDAARGRRVPHRAWPEREVYGSAYRVKDEITIEDLFAAHAPRDRPRDRRRPQPAHAQPRAAALTGERALRRSAHHRRRLASARSAASRPTNVVIASGTRPARPEGRRVRRAHDPRLRRHPAARPHPLLDGRGRRRRGRHRVRVDVRRARHARDGRRAAPATARVLRRADRRGAAVPPARPRRHLPLRRVRRRRRPPRRRHRHGARERQAHPGRGGALLRRPPGRHRALAPGEGRARRPTSAAASRSGPTTAPRSSTSSPSAT